jgi:hypothetical protein
VTESVIATSGGGGRKKCHVTEGSSRTEDDRDRSCD